MHQPRLILLSSLTAVLVFSATPAVSAKGAEVASSSATQPSSPASNAADQVHSRAVLPVSQQRVLTPVLAWIFANIRVTAMGPNTVRIEWVPVNGADEYRVYRNGLALGPVYSSAPTATQPITVYDYTAPAGSTLGYCVTAAHKTTTAGLPGTPAAGKLVALETLLQTSNTVSVATPPPPLRINDWAVVINALHAGKYGAVRPALWGFADLHTHPLSYLGFGGKLIFGAVDQFAPLPPTRTLLNTPCWPPPIPASQLTAMGPPFENIVFGTAGVENPCGDSLRAGVITALAGVLGAAWYPGPTYLHSGPPNFITWPAWNDLLRQKMWVDWIRRSYQGGLRVMVALAVNNKLLGDMTAGPGDLPDDDATTADKQIDEIRAFVARHADFMQLALNSTDVYNAVSRNKLAVVVGVEIDHIGNLVGPVPAPVINAEIDRLYGKGVRYIFPVHLVDNPIGASAVYSDLFNVANVYENAAPMYLTCESGIGYNYSPPSAALTAVAFVKLGTHSPGVPPAVPCMPGFGNVNAGSPNGFVGLTPAGKIAVQHMMDLGMLIDVDHMSELAVTDTIQLAQQNMPVAYPLMSGHNNLRFVAGSNSERQLNSWQYAQIGLLHGMAGIGGAKADAALWLNTFQQTLGAMVPANVPAGAFGTDADGMEFMMPPRPGSSVNPTVAHPPIPALPMSKDGNRTWDYNHDGVAHYGLLPDYLEDVASLPGGQAAVQRMFGGAQYFYETWFLAERDKR